MTDTEHTHREHKNPDQALRAGRNALRSVRPGAAAPFAASSAGGSVLGSADKRTILGTLLALFDLARGDDPARADNVAGRLGVSPAAVAKALVHLEARGLVDAGRVRLTLRGLSTAAALRRHGSERREQHAA